MNRLTFRGISGDTELLKVKSAQVHKWRYLMLHEFKKYYRDYNYRNKYLRMLLEESSYRANYMDKVSELFPLIKKLDLDADVPDVLQELPEVESYEGLWELAVVIETLKALGYEAAIRLYFLDHNTKEHSDFVRVHLEYRSLKKHLYHVFSLLESSKFSIDLSL